MTTQPGTPQDPLQKIAETYLDGYRGQKARVLDELDAMETTEGRERLAVTRPDWARALESHTREDREQRLEEWAVALGVARAILFAIHQMGLRP